MKYILPFIFLLSVLGASWLTPWSQPRASITVSGQSKQQVSNQVAHFNVNVTQAEDDKQKAIDSVNKAMAEITAAVKKFGIADKDLTTQSISVNEVTQPEILIYPPQPGTKTGEKQWQANNSLAIILRDTSQASALTDLLQNFPLAEVSGPGFSVEDTKAADAELLVQAVEDARQKAEQVARASGRKLGKVITVSESGGVYPLYRAAVAESKSGTSAPLEPGSTQLSQSVSVVFELK